MSAIELHFQAFNTLQILGLKVISIVLKCHSKSWEVWHACRFIMIKIFIVKFLPKLLVVHLIMIATVLLSSQYISAIQDLAAGHRELHRREVIEMDTPLTDQRDNSGNISGLQARLDRDSLQCPTGYFR